MRSPRALWRELGPSGFFAFQIVVGGTVMAALVHPWFYALACFELAEGGLLARPGSVFGWPFWLVAWFDLLAGYLATMGLGGAPPGLSLPADTDSVDAALLAADFGGGLSGAVAVYDGAVRLGEDRAWGPAAVHLKEKN
jgi:hypothetical protein